MPRNLVRFLTFALFGSLTLFAQRDRLTSRIDTARTLVMQGRVHPRVRGAADLGRVDTSFAMPGLTLVLKPSDASAIQQLVRDQQDPASPRFHQWLTPEQYADQYGASSADVQKIVDWLQSQGFQVTRVGHSRTAISFAGTAGQADAAFRTEIRRFRTANGEQHFANASDPSIPAALAGMVAGIRGLNDFHPKPRYRQQSIDMLTTASGVHHIAPDDFAALYNVAPLYQAGVDGTGQKIAVVGQTNINTSDITNFRSKFNLPAANLTRTLVPGRRNPGVLDGDVQEAALDIEWSGAVARNAQIVYVYSDDVWESVIYAIDSNVAPVLTMSYGACEPSDLIDLPMFQQLAQQANAQGITWLAASGDAGATDCDDRDALVAQNGFAVDIPGAIPEVTAMGGTAFDEQGGAYWNSGNTANSASAIGYIPERVWNDSGSGFGLAAGGGGASTFFARPSWQNGPGVPHDAARHVPDLSLSASAQHDGYYVVAAGSAGYFGGTSVAAPAMAGVIALLNQYVVSTGAQAKAGLGNINPALYRLAQTTSGAFHDVTGGDNGSPCASGTPDCNNGLAAKLAGIGYDEASGLGSVDAFNLVHQWSSLPAGTSAVSVSIDQNPVFQQSPDASGNRWRFQLTLTEEGGAGTTFTDFSIDGVSYAAQIAQLFGSASIAAGGSISAKIGMQNVAAPKTVAMHFAGIDATGRTWTSDLVVPFQSAQIAPSIAGVSNAASGRQSFAPGMILSVYGAGFTTAVQSAAAIPLPQYLAGFQAMINGVPAPIYYVSPTQVNLQIPYETQPGTASLTIYTPYQTVSYRFNVAATAPGIFTFVDGAVNPSRSGLHGQTVTLFVTGEGGVTPTLATGDTPSARTALSALPRPSQPVTVTVGGVSAPIQFIGIPNGLVGATQINFTIPPDAPAGTQPVIVSVGGIASQSATIVVQ